MSRHVAALHAMRHRERYRERERGLRKEILVSWVSGDVARSHGDGWRRRPFQGLADACSLQSASQRADWTKHIARSPFFESRKRTTASCKKLNLWRVGPARGRFETFKLHIQVNLSNGSGIWEPQLEIVWIEIMRTDRSCVCLKCPRIVKRKFNGRK